MNKVQEIISNTIDYSILTFISDHFLNLGNYIGKIINFNFIISKANGLRKKIKMFSRFGSIRYRRSKFWPIFSNKVN